MAQTKITVDGITGLTSSATELNYVDITTLGTAQASKVLTADANIDVGLGLRNLTGTGFLQGSTILVKGTTNSITIDADNPSAYTVVLPNAAPAAGKVLKTTSSSTTQLEWGDAGGVDISEVTNGSSDRIATFTSTTALNGEANLTFDGQNLYLINSTTDSSSNLMVNSSATSGTTHARLILRVASGNAGDAFISFHDQGGAEWAFGLDNSDSGKLKLGYGGTVETNTILAIDTNGQVQIREIIADGSGQQTNYTSVQKGLAKAWGNATSNGSLESGSHNVSSYSRTSAGNYRVTYSTAMEGGNYSAFSAALMDDHLSQPYLRSATTVDITVRNNSHGSDDEGNCFVIFGELS